MFSICNQLLMYLNFIQFENSLLLITMHINDQIVERNKNVDFVQLKNDMVIAIDAESISVYKSKNEYFECRDPLITYPPDE